MITDQNGNVVARHDFLPFGEEIGSGYAGRTSQFGATDTASQKFTGQYRDSESNLDFFNARYYGGALGRFLSPDPGNAGADPTDPHPQTWNAYGYVRNSPLVNVDPTGDSFWSIVGDIFSLGINVTLGSGNGSAPNFPGGPDAPWSENVPTAPPPVSSAGPLIINNVIAVDGSDVPAQYPLGAGPIVPSGVTLYDIAIEYLSTDPGMRAIISYLRESKTVYTIKLNRGSTDYFDPSTNTVYWDPHSGMFTTGGGSQSAALSLGHELAHARGPIRPGVYAFGNSYDNPEEQRVIDGPASL